MQKVIVLLIIFSFPFIQGCNKSSNSYINPIASTDSIRCYEDGHRVYTDNINCK